MTTTINNRPARLYKATPLDSIGFPETNRGFGIVIVYGDAPEFTLVKPNGNKVTRRYPNEDMSALFTGATELLRYWAISPLSDMLEDDPSGKGDNNA